MKKHKICFIIILLYFINSTQQSSPNYLIPSYFGSKEQDFLEK